MLIFQWVHIQSLRGRRDNLDKVREPSRPRDARTPIITGRNNGLIVIIIGYNANHRPHVPGAQGKGEGLLPPVLAGDEPWRVHEPASPNGGDLARISRGLQCGRPHPSRRQLGASAVPRRGRAVLEPAAASGRSGRTAPPRSRPPSIRGRYHPSYSRARQAKPTHIRGRQPPGEQEERA
jgi:hypothetical protein